MGGKVFCLSGRPGDGDSCRTSVNCATQPSGWLAARCGACWHEFAWLCHCLRLGAQCEEPHHVLSDREPQQVDAGLDPAAQG